MAGLESWLLFCSVWVGGPGEGKGLPQQGLYTRQSLALAVKDPCNGVTKTSVGGVSAAAAALYSYPSAACSPCLGARPQLLLEGVKEPAALHQLGSCSLLWGEAVPPPPIATLTSGRVVCLYLPFCQHSPSALLAPSCAPWELIPPPSPPKQGAAPMPWTRAESSPLQGIGAACSLQG